MGGGWQTCRRRVFLLSKISVFLLLQVQHKLAELKTALSVCRAFVDSCLSLHNISKLDSEMASMAKYWATDLENRVAGDCLQLHGGKTFQYHHWVWCPPSFLLVDFKYDVFSEMKTHTSYLSRAPRAVPVEKKIVMWRNLSI